MRPEINGIVVLDKPADMSSAKAVARVKALFGARKVGHAGTLDPFATGVLVCCLNRATRLARFLLHGWKEYDARLRLGVETDTQDATGSVVATHATVAVSDAQLTAAFKRFEGDFDQVPPVYSALKHQGVPLYRLARRGQAVEKPARRVTVAHIAIQALRLPVVDFHLRCSAGTYVRTLCADIGRDLGCGGHLAALRRTRSSGFGIENALTLAALERHAAGGTLAGCVVPMAAALPQMPSVTADESLAAKIRNGVPLTSEAVFADGRPIEGLVRILGPDQTLLAVIEQPAGSRECMYLGVFCA